MLKPMITSHAERGLRKIVVCKATHQQRAEDDGERGEYSHRHPGGHPVAGDQLVGHEREQCRDHTEIAVISSIEICVVPYELVAVACSQTTAREEVVRIRHRLQYRIDRQIEPRMPMDECVRQPLVLFMIHIMARSGVIPPRPGHRQRGDGHNERAPCDHVHGRGRPLPVAVQVHMQPVDR